ncbi:MAG: acyl-CoA synthetase (AMP-forming)/AMP-acid ligase, partial [Mycobacterium sp.]|nr:acyl-CoA synthetase (AMP-forming)/AMP-acid ligase [Mycobacterium sp.]
ITYSELAGRVRDKASDMSAEIIGVLVSHTPAVVENLLGIFEAGGTYFPIDAALPAERRLSLAATVRVSHIITATAGSQDAEVDFARTPPPQHDQDFDDSAYILCTSGSTGRPKPVVVSHRALGTTVRALRELFSITPEDRVLQFASLGWDTCLEEMLPALTAGAALVFHDAAHSGSFPSFTRMLDEQKVTVLDLPTAFWHELVLYLHEERATLPSSVRLVVIGGERVDPTRMRQWRARGLAHVDLLNTYGCTETTMITHAVYLDGPSAEVESAEFDDEVPLGRPLPHVLEHISEQGELLVAGPGLASGYLMPPEHTEAAFPVYDHGSGPRRWFRTGDVVVRGDKGLLYSRGRMDEQVKVLGVRVHPAEVETQLNTHPAVGGAVVVGERRLGRMSLTAYIVRVGTTTPGELQRHVRQRLPGQFVPSSVKFVAALSYTTSGKIDRAATHRAAVDTESEGGGR